MSLLKANSVQIGQSTTGTNNFTLSVPSSPDGTIKLARGNSGATTADVLTVNASGAITGATITSSTINGGTITSGTSVASTSGTAIDFTGIPSWVKRITVMFNGVSTNGTNIFQVQLGTGGTPTYTTTGYLSVGLGFGPTTGSVTAVTTGFVNDAGGGAASNTAIGNYYITNLTGNSWNYTASMYRNTTAMGFGSGSITLGASLTAVRITTIGGTDTFDAGSINILYEG